MSTEHDRRGHLAAIAALDGMGPARLRALLAAVPPEELWALLLAGAGRRLVSAQLGDEPVGAGRVFEDQSLPARPLLPLDVIKAWEHQVRSTPHTPAEMADRIEALDLEVRTGGELPEALAADHDPPGVLFMSGFDIDSQRPRVAIVGTRKASEYGLRIARSLGHDLARAGVEVVSGLALGIDAAAHAGALEGSGGRTPLMAVIGAGHDRPCPLRNRGLARAVAAAGSVVSEVPPGIPSAPWRYPVRNRLIAGLADVVVVVESASWGGSMSTVAEALARDRVVMAVPGSVGRRTAEGCHDLLRDGAEICTGSGDVLAGLALLGFSPASAGESGHQDADPSAQPEAEVEVAPGGDAATVLELLAEGPRTVDSLLSATGLDLVDVSSVLAAMETASWVAIDAGWVRRVR